MYPTLFRNVPQVAYQRQRIATPDDDFIDLDISASGQDKMVLILHGLEGDASRKYMLGLVHLLNRNGFDTVSMNFRGCSGEPNRQLRFYHSGDTGDLRHVLTGLRQKYPGKQLYLAGFSLGGNVLLKFLGEEANALQGIVQAAVAISVPCDLADSSKALEQRQNFIYMKRFIGNLKGKLEEKALRFPGAIDLGGFERIKTFRQFDDRFTAPIHGFKDAIQYWTLSSSKPLLRDIKIPTLLVNAQNDPFLGKSCYPFEAAAQNPNFFLETPSNGGHVGFVTFGNPYYWSEHRTLAFFQNLA